MGDEEDSSVTCVLPVYYTPHTVQLFMRVTYHGGCEGMPVQSHVIPIHAYLRLWQEIFWWWLKIDTQKVAVLVSVTLFVVA